MKKLKKKVFLVIFLILTLVTTGILVIYNAQLYNQKYHIISENLRQSQRGYIFDKFDDEFYRPEGDFAPDDIGNIRFMDITVYTVILDSDNSVKYIINHSSNKGDYEKIQELAENVVAGEACDYIGNLYVSQYSYSVNPYNSVTVIDNSSTNSELTKTLITSLAIYLALEIIILLISSLLTLWIAKPVAESFEKQKQFIADASHELKTPLAVIIASSDALDSNPSEAKWLGNIKSEADRMNKLIADLLDLAKSEETDDKSQFTIGNLSKTVEMSALTFESVMFEKGVMLEDDIEENIELNMNQYKIKQLMSILLDNAVKHSDKGSAIKVCLKKDRDIVLTVTNKGEGIPKGEEEKIFERFYRADESRNRNENRYGLGLAIAKNIAQSHNAEISAKSENGLTTFKVIFKK